jgi:DNA-binding CsgD family transcriptional regulator
MSREIDKPLLKLSKEKLKQVFDKRRNRVNKFSDFMYRYIDTIKHVKYDYCFLLADEEGYLINIKYRPGMMDSDCEYRDFFIPGVSFGEESIGTNSIPIAGILKRPIHMYPGFQYLDRLKDWYEYCIPIVNRSKIAGYIVVISFCQPVSKALEGFADLLAVNTFSEYFETGDGNVTESGMTTQLTEKQCIILKMIARGLSDEHISQELSVSLAAVKYHNQAIFKKLNATSRVDAVVKAIMLNKITFYDLYNKYA